MSFNQVPFRDLILETKDGDWGKDEEKAGFVPYRVIRGGDFPDVEIGTISKVPTCYLKKSTVVRRTLRAGDLLIETAGGTKKKPTGRVVYISQELLDKFNLPVTCASFARFIRIDEEKVNPKFIFWYLRNMYEKGEMWQHQVQHTGVARFQWTKFADGFMFDLPTRTRQNEAVEVLGALQKKIVANLIINQTLESMAQTIFKSWFVDFEPVKAKIAALESGEDAEGITCAAMRAISGKTDDELDKMEGGRAEDYAKLKTTAGLFPMAMQETELGEVPEGWDVGSLSDICHLNTKSWTKKDLPNEIRYVDLANTKNGCIQDVQIFTWKDAPSRARRILSEGDTIIGTVRPGNKAFSYIGDIYPQLTASTGFAVLTPKEKYYREYLYIAATSEDNFSRMAHLADGGAYPAIRPNIVTEHQCIVPTEGVFSSFSSITKPIIKKLDFNRSEGISLAQLRDTLLPKLLSGELSVDAIKITNEQ